MSFEHHLQVACTACCRATGWITFFLISQVSAQLLMTPSISAQSILESASEDAHWARGFHFAGTENPVYAFTVYRGQLIAGGGFTIAGASLSQGIASWDGQSWHPLGTGISGACNSVWALTVYDDELIAGGCFASAGGDSAVGIAAWNGSTWRPLGGGVSGSVFALAVYNGRLIAGGQFTQAGGVPASNLAQWNGNSWSPLATSDGWVEVLTVYNGNLIVGGEFTQIGGISARHIAAWNGSTWSALGAGVDLGVYALTVQHGDLIIGGFFTGYSGLTKANGIARWDGNSWSNLGDGVGGYLLSSVRALVVAPDGALVAGGSFQTAGGVSVNSIARWDGSSWNALGPGFTVPSSWHLPTEVRALAIYDGSLFAGGFMSVSGDVRVNNLARWDGNAWQPIDSGLGLDGVVYALTVHEGNLVAGGNFEHAGTTRMTRIARFDGTAWQGFASGVNDEVRALTSAGGDLVVGGLFTKAGGVPASRVARWDGAAWRPMGAGFDSTVYALDLYNGDVIAGGMFGTSGATSVKGIARWDGAAWKPLGTSVDDGIGVFSLALYGGALVAAGAFTSMGGMPANNIARWDGNAWSSMGSVVGRVFALGTYQNDLIAAGSFSSVGEVPVNNIARWNGSSWSAMGDGVDHHIYSVSVFGGDLFATGAFFGGNLPNHIARWSGGSWHALGSGLSSIGRALAPYRGSLFVGGDFATAGDTPSWAIARWDSLPVAVEVSDFEALSIGSGVVLRWQVSKEALLGLTGVRVERAGSAAGPFVERTTSPLTPAVSMSFQDSAEEGRTYWYRLELLGSGRQSVIAGPIRIIVSPRSTTTKLYQPLETRNGLVEIHYVIASRASISLSIYDVQGRLLRVLERGPREPGTYSSTWDRNSVSGRRVSRGVYLVRLVAGSVIRNSKFVVVSP